MKKGRIETQFIQELLARIDIVDLISSYVDLKKAGRNYTGLCPFHGEKTPSFSVSSDKQFYHCFGCGVSGDAIKFIQEYRHFDFVEAVENLASATGLSVVYEKNQNSNFRSKNAAKNAEAKSKLEQKKQRGIELLSATKDFYEESFYADRFTQVRSYWQNRGFDHKIAKLFDIGFAEGQGLVNYLENKGFSFKEIEEQGLATKSERGEVKEKFWQRLIFPIRDAKGTVLGFGGRVINSDRKPKYLNSPETFLFDKSNIIYGLHQVKISRRKIDKILITEGYLDVIALFQAGIDYSVATMGTAIGETHISQLLKVSKNLIFCFDGDKAGFKAAQRGLLAVLPFLHKLEDIRFLILEAGEDPDSIIKKQGKDLFESRANKAIPLVEFFLEFIGANSMENTIDAKIKLINKSIPYLAQLPKNIYASDFIINKVADLASTNIANIQKEIEKFEQKQSERAKFSEQISKNRLALDAKVVEENRDFNSYQVDASEYSENYTKDFEYTDEDILSSFAEEKSLVAEVSYLLEVLMQDPKLATLLDDSLILKTNHLFFGILQKIKSMALVNKNLKQSDIFAYWYGTEAGDFLSKILQNSVLLTQIEEQFNLTQKNILLNLEMREIKTSKIEESLSTDERNKLFLEKIKKLQELKK